MGNNFEIEIDLVPYAVEFNSNKKTLEIKDCFGSVLGNLYKRDNTERNTSFIINKKEKAVLLTFEFKNDEDILVTFTPRQSKSNMVDLITSWIDDNLHEISEIGYETLNRRNNVIKNIKGIGYEYVEDKKKQTVSPSKI